MNIWRLNVRITQIQSCIHYRKFAIAARPRNPEIEKGDFLLLQLVKDDARRFGKLEIRIQYALVFDHYEYDHDGTISRHFWPDAEKTWPWIMHCSDMILIWPFSLDTIDLHYNYGIRTNPIRIHEEDVESVLPYILRYGKIAEIGKRITYIMEREPAHKKYKLWLSLQNNDRIVEDSPDQVTWVTVPEHKEIKRNPELPVILKYLYDHKCQICEHDFKPKYGKPYSETHHVIWLSRGGVDHSNNLIVVCPNHHRIIHEVKPEFDRAQLAFMYPNSLQEHLQLKDHLKDPALMKKIEKWAAKRVSQINKEKNVC